MASAHKKVFYRCSHFPGKWLQLGLGAVSYGRSRNAGHLLQLQPHFLSHELPQPTESEVVAIGSLDNILGRVIPSYGQAVLAGGSKRNLLQARKSALALMGMVFKRVQQGSLQSLFGGDSHLPKLSIRGLTD